MAISHKDHDHPNTPAARATCRKAMNANCTCGDADMDTLIHSRTCPMSPNTEDHKIGRIISSDDEARLADGLVDGVHPRRAAKVTVVPRTRGDGGVVKGMRATEPKAATRRLKVSGTKIKSIGDLADVPAVLAPAIRVAWDVSWDVVAGTPFNDDERRVIVHAPIAEVAMVWDSNGRTAYFVRNWNSSVTFRVKGAMEAFDVANDASRWTAAGNLA